MGILTTTIGAYPKPEFLREQSFREVAPEGEGTTREFVYSADDGSDVSVRLYDEATERAVLDQVGCGIDIPTDGEQRRENYIHYHCRHLDGIRFDVLTEKVHRNGAAMARLPTITSQIKPRGGHFLHKDFISAQRVTDKPVKITVPGPATIADTTANDFYADERELAFDLADALSFEIRHLAEMGCKHIQVDEPLFARNVNSALNFGVEALERCFHKLPKGVTRIMHMCCGYPGHLDDETYLKADPSCYFELADAVDASVIDQVSIEDAHRFNDLTLLERFTRSTVVLGVVAIARSRIETTAEVSARLMNALQHIDKERLIAAPDCGLMMLDRATAMKKLKRMCLAAHGLK